MSKSILTRRELAQKVIVGAAGAILLPALTPQAQAQVVDPKPDVPPPLPAAAAASGEGALLTQMVPVNVGYALTETQAKEVALQLKDYPGPFAKARSYALPDDIGPAFAADAPGRKGRVR